MSLYKRLSEIGAKYFGKANTFKYGFNWSPMYRRSTGKVTEVSTDLKRVEVKIPINYKNRNYANSIFGGSLYSAVDPIYMIQLISILGDDYIVWDKAAEIYFKRPAKEAVYAEFVFSDQEIEDIIESVKKEKEIDVAKKTQLRSKDGSKLFCEIVKTLYVADKSFYLEKMRKRCR